MFSDMKCKQTPQPAHFSRTFSLAATGIHRDLSSHISADGRNKMMVANTTRKSYLSASVLFVLNPHDSLTAVRLGGKMGVRALS